jgi:thiamine biosynthesis lipoprotein
MLAVLLSSSPALAEWLSDARPMLGTEVSVYLWSADGEAGRQALEGVFEEAARIDHLMSTYRDDSEISKINRDAGNVPVATGVELFALLGEPSIFRSLRTAPSILRLTALDNTTISAHGNGLMRTPSRPNEKILITDW